MLLHFGNLAMHMNGELVLRKVSVAPTRSPALPGAESCPFTSITPPPQAPPSTYAEPYSPLYRVLPLHLHRSTPVEAPPPASPALRKCRALPHAEPCPCTSRAPPPLRLLPETQAPPPQSTLGAPTKAQWSACLALTQEPLSPPGLNRVPVLLDRCSTLGHLTHSPEPGKLSRRLWEGRVANSHPRLME